MFLEQSPNEVHIMSGRTVEALKRNVIDGEFGLLAMLDRLAKYHRGDNVLTINTATGTKICHCFGANDEQSYTKLRGLTAGGWYADEVSQQPLSFIEEAFRRTIASGDRRHFWTLNPETPLHYIYTSYIDIYEKEKLKGFHLWKFYLDDNLAITDERKEELKRQYHGIFYQRYIKGERISAEGRVYDTFGESCLYNNAEKPKFEGNKFRRSIAVDYGTHNACVFLDCYFNGKIVYIDNEYRWDSEKEQLQKTNSEYADDMEQFIKLSYGNPQIIVDPSAAAFILELQRKHRYVRPAGNDVMNGIQTVSTLFGNGKLKINRDNCSELIKELEGYAWDKKAALRGEEKPIKERDHGADALRYYCYTDVPSYARSAKT
jgi:PBSX family phage terminase large subunit